MEDNVARHTVHWDDTNGTHVFRVCLKSEREIVEMLITSEQVGNTLYKLDSKALSRASVMFSDMFFMPGTKEKVSVADEGTELNPIVIPNVSEVEFDIFVSQAYGL
jgi:hypothetical protein